MNALLIIHWDADPNIISLSGIPIISGIVLRWYGLLFMTGFLLGSHFLKKLFVAEGHKAEDTDTITFYIMVGTIIGARLGHCLFYQPDFYLSNPIEILKIWRGGLASHGGAIGILIAIWLYSRTKKDQTYLWVLDRCIIFVALGGCFIRLGNLANSEIIGIPTDVPWAFVFERVDQTPRHPAQLYEALSSLLLCILLYNIHIRIRHLKKDGFLFGIFLCILFGLRFFYEFIKENQVAFEDVLFLNMGQFLSIPFVIVGIGLLIYSNRKTKNIDKGREVTRARASKK